MAGSREREQAALREVVREVKGQPPPDVDWPELERKLLARTRASGPPAPRSRFGLYMAFGAAAAVVVALIIALVRPDGSELGGQARWTGSAAGQGTLRAVNGDRLAVGDVVLTGASAARVEHAGQARWTLAPHSRATLQARGPVIEVRLDRGSVQAEVTPAARPESFVVEVARARVAVHGTVFRVTHAPDRVHVEVREGVVAVSPAEPSGNHRFMLHAPVSAHFNLDGTRGWSAKGELIAEPAPKRASREARAPARAAQPGRRTAPPAALAARPTQDLEVDAGPTAELPRSPSTVEVEQGVGLVADAVKACFLEHTPERGDMRVTARTTLVLDVLPDGTIQRQIFHPPLAPGVSACARQRSLSLRFGASREGVSITRFLELSR